MDGGARWAAVHGVAKSRTRLSDFTFTFHFHALEKEMATHSSVLAWRILDMGQPDGLLSMGSQRVGHDLAAAATCLRRQQLSFIIDTIHNSSKGAFSHSFYHIENLHSIRHILVSRRKVVNRS